MWLKHKDLYSDKISPEGYRNDFFRDFFVKNHTIDW